MMKLFNKGSDTCTDDVMWKNLKGDATFISGHMLPSIDHQQNLLFCFPKDKQSFIRHLLVQ